MDLLIWVLLGVSLAGSIYYQLHQLEQPTRVRSIAKAFVTSPIAVIGVYVGAPTALIVAFAISTTVDVILSVGASRKILVTAMVLQSVALLLYGVAFGMYWVGFPSIELAVLVLGGFGVTLLAMLWAKLDWMKLPVILYISCVIAMMTMSFGIDEPHRLAALGGVLFAISTSIHAIEQFHFSWPSVLYRFSGPPIWISYHAAMLCFVFAFV